MRTKSIRSEKKEGLSTVDVGAAILIERLRKLRALNASPADVGIDKYLYSELFYNRPNSVSKIL